MKRKNWILLLIAVVGILIIWKMTQKEHFDSTPLTIQEARDLKAQMLAVKDRLIPANYPPIPSNEELATPELMQVSLNNRRSFIDAKLEDVNQFIHNPIPSFALTQHQRSLLIDFIENISTPTGLPPSPHPPNTPTTPVPSTSTTSTSTTPVPSTSTTSTSTTPVPSTSTTSTSTTPVPSTSTTSTSTTPVPSTSTSGSAASTTAFSTPATSTGTTTGGSSTSSLGPTAGTNMGREVWGPAFTELGSPAEGDTITRDPREIKHPQLYGPSTKGGKTLMEGIGLVAESKNAQLANSGSLPSSSGLGSDGNSGFLPYSRVPGDQDMIPNPYLPGGEFSSSTYSVKTEPVPFLTDFSAFMK